MTADKPARHQAYNPYLPGWEYVPDGEPHVFGDRVYVYGSHDRAGAHMFCLNDYVCWSAPVSDLSDWRLEGTIWPRGDDPANPHGRHSLFAPDVARGTDGRYYLYYGMGWTGLIGVAVCDEPAGTYQFLGHVQHPGGTPMGRATGDPFGFDPAVLVDKDGRVWLYSGFHNRIPAVATGGRRLAFDGCYCFELEPDMHTVRSCRLVLPKAGPGSFEGHEFFEASSIRRYDDTYYLVYSSRVNHELCYATASSPTGPFAYGGVLVSNGDVGLPGHPDEAHAANYTGNNHGGMLRLGDDYYIFYHRQTNRTSYSRQTCAERLTCRPDGGFAQAELTSCGLNGGPLSGVGTYPARIACNLWSTKGTGRYDVPLSHQRYANHPFLTQDEPDGESGVQYVANLRNGAVAGYKYFSLRGLVEVEVTIRGITAGVLEVATDPAFRHPIARVQLASTREWRPFVAQAKAPDGVCALYFRYRGTGAIDLRDFTLRDAALHAVSQKCQTPL